MLHGTYVGSLNHLRGKGALLRAYELMATKEIMYHRVLAQFDDTKILESFGWHQFLVTEFEIEPITDTRNL